jgi:hypothetical protein
MCHDVCIPEGRAQSLKDRISTQGDALNNLRDKVLAEHAGLTLTKIYNVLSALREGRVLTDEEREVHDLGLVTLIRQHHDEIDNLVAQAYGWPADWCDEQVLIHLVSLNQELAAEEAKGLIRWLRPEFQAPVETTVVVNRDLDLGDIPSAAAKAMTIPWPKALPDQVSAVAAQLISAQAPRNPRDVARAFKGKRAASIIPILDALASIGQARRLADGRYVA